MLGFFETVVFLLLFLFFKVKQWHLVQLHPGSYQLTSTSKLKAIKSGVLRESVDPLKLKAKCYPCI